MDVDYSLTVAPATKGGSTPGGGGTQHFAGLISNAASLHVTVVVGVQAG